MWKYLRYAWRVLMNLVEIGVTLLIFAGVHERQTTLIVAILGIIYVSTRTGMISTSVLQMNFAKGLVREFHGLRVLFGDPDLESYEAANTAGMEQLNEVLVKLYINMTGTGVVGLISTFQLLTHLS